ncbi:MAG TPA: ABC transporter permease [Rhizomicrobium sp.]|nr:ABC transporter permease [Rhizomicrobium sp.]
MTRALLVARSEFLKYVTRRGFIISLLLFPVWLVVAGLVPQWIESKTPTRSFTVVDHTGGEFAFAIAKAVRDDTDGAERDALSDYAAANIDMAKVRAKMPALAAMLDAPSGDAGALAQFRASGGVDGVLAQVGPWRKPGAVFEPPRPRFQFKLPGALERSPAPGFAHAASTRLSGHRALYAVVLVPQGFSGAKTSPAAEFWSVNASDPELEHFVQRALTDELRRQVLAHIAPDVAPETLKPSARLRALDPAASSGNHQLSLADQARTYAPAVLAFLLLLTIFMNAGALLSGVIEEKSSRIVEVMLSCVTPVEFMTGKLLGAAAASLLTLILWAAMLIGGAAIFLPGAAANIGNILLSIFSTGLLPMLLLCFICGLLIYASIFLAIGSMATSIQDAQALVGPTMILVMAPLIMMPALLRDPNGTIATVLSWIPIYTPFFLMFRLPWHPPMIELIGATLLMLVTTVLLVFQMGRVFAAHVLTTERPPRLGAMLRKLIGRR